MSDSDKCFHQLAHKMVIFTLLWNDFTSFILCFQNDVFSNVSCHHTLRCVPLMEWVIDTNLIHVFSGHWCENEPHTRFHTLQIKRLSGLVIHVLALQAFLCQVIQFSFLESLHSRTMNRPPQGPISSYYFPSAMQNTWEVVAAVTMVNENVTWTILKPNSKPLMEWVIDTNLIHVFSGHWCENEPHTWFHTLQIKRLSGLVIHVLALQAFLCQVIQFSFLESLHSRMMNRPPQGPISSYYFPSAMQNTWEVVAADRTLCRSVHRSAVETLEKAELNHLAEKRLQC